MNDVAVIEALQNTWMQGWVARDRTVLDGILAPGFALRSITTDDLVDRATWLESAISGRVQGSSFAYTHMRVTIDGDTAVTDSLLAFVGTIGGKEWSTSAWCTDVWSRSSGRWQVVKRHSSPAVGRGGSMTA